MRSRIAVLASVLALVAALPGVASAAPGQGPVSEHARIVAYWTPQRMANAKPRDFVLTAQHDLVPAVKPGGGGGGGHGHGDTGDAVTGASWTSGGVVEEQTGRVLFHMSDGDWICSASTLSDGHSNDGYSLVLSAGHCAFDGSGGWATYWIYIPDFDAVPTYDCASAKYGCWTANALVLSSAFVSGGGFGNATVGYDWSIAVVGPGGKNGTTQLDSLPGYPGYSLKTTGNSIGDPAWPFGYPAAGKYNGSDLTYCKGTTVRDRWSASTWGIACDMTGGSSGGPWVVGTTNPATTAGEIASLNSYRYNGLNYMFGPRFNSHTLDVYNAANALTPDATGIDHITVP